MPIGIRLAHTSSARGEVADEYIQRVAAGQSPLCMQDIPRSSVPLAAKMYSILFFVIQTEQLRSIEQGYRATSMPRLSGLFVIT